MIDPAVAGTLHLGLESVRRASELDGGGRRSRRGTEAASGRSPVARSRAVRLATVVRFLRKRLHAPTAGLHDAAEA